MWFFRILVIVTVLSSHAALAGITFLPKWEGAAHGGYGAAVYRSEPVSLVFTCSDNTVWDAIIFLPSELPSKNNSEAVSKLALTIMIDKAKSFDAAATVFRLLPENGEYFLSDPASPEPYKRLARGSANAYSIGGISLQEFAGAIGRGASMEFELVTSAGTLTSGAINLDGAAQVLESQNCVQPQAGLAQHWKGDDSGAISFANSGSEAISISCDGRPSMVVSTPRELTKIDKSGALRAPITVYFPKAEFRFDFVAVEFGTPGDGEGSMFTYGVNAPYHDGESFEAMFWDMKALMGTDEEIYFASLNADKGNLEVFAVFSLDGAESALDTAGCTRQVQEPSESEQPQQLSPSEFFANMGGWEYEDGAARVTNLTGAILLQCLLDSPLVTLMLHKEVVPSDTGVYAFVVHIDRQLTGGLLLRPPTENNRVAFGDVEFFIYGVDTDHERFSSFIASLKSGGVVAFEGMDGQGGFDMLGGWTLEGSRSAIDKLDCF